MDKKPSVDAWKFAGAVLVGFMGGILVLVAQLAIYPFMACLRLIRAAIAKAEGR